MTSSSSTPMRLRSAVLPDLDGSFSPSTPRKLNKNNRPRTPNSGGGVGGGVRRVPSGSGAGIALGPRPRKASARGGGRASRRAEGEGSGNESSGSAPGGVLRKGGGGGGRSRGGGGRVRFKGLKGRRWERIEVLVGILCFTSILFLAIFMFHIFRPTTSSPSSSSLLQPNSISHPSSPPSPIPKEAQQPPPIENDPPPTSTSPQARSMEDKVRLAAEELGVSTEALVRSLQGLAGAEEEEAEENLVEAQDEVLMGWED